MTGGLANGGVRIIAYCRGRSEFVFLSFEEEYSLGPVPVIAEAVHCRLMMSGS